MASKVVSDAVDAFLAANWTICPIYVENSETETPSDGSPFLLVQYFAANTTRETLTSLYQEEGDFRIVIHVEAGAGMAKMRQWGALLLDLFRDRIAVPDQIPPGIQTLIPEAPFVQGSPDGNYLVGAMVVPYRYAYEPS